MKIFPQTWTKNVKITPVELSFIYMYCTGALVPGKPERFSLYLTNSRGTRQGQGCLPLSKKSENFCQKTERKKFFHKIYL